MDRKRKIIIISLVIIILIILVVLLILFWPFGKKPVEVTPEEQTTPVTNQIEQLPPPGSKRVEDEKNYPLGLEPLAMSYAERFASYSSDANFKNLEDLVTLSTSKMQSFINNFIATSEIGSNGYEAVEAKALNSQLIFLKDNDSVLVISLQLTKFSGDKANFTTDYGKLELRAVKSGDEWKIDEVKWL